MAKTLALILGIILVLLGLLGFVSNPLIGANALFAADAAHNVIHIILGAVLIGVGVWSPTGSTRSLKIIGGVAFVLGLIGIFTVPSSGGTLLGIAQTNGASNWLHLVAGAIIFLAGLYAKDSVGMEPAPQSQQPV